MAFLAALKVLFREQPQWASNVEWGKVSHIVLSSERDFNFREQKHMAEGHDLNKRDISAWMEWRRTEDNYWRFACEIRTQFIKRGWKPPKESPQDWVLTLQSEQQSTDVGGNIS